MPTPWPTPPGMTGDPDLIRISSGAQIDDEYTCPEFVGLKARPAILAVVQPRRPKPPLEDFTLAPFMAALDAIEFHGTSVGAALRVRRAGARPAHPGLSRYTEHAVESYLRAAGRLDQPGALEPVPDYWVAKQQNGALAELYAWGRRYQSADGRTRELRFLRYGSAERCERDTGQIALAAYSTAFGEDAPWPRPWQEPFERRGLVRVELIRIVEVGLTDGSYHLCFEGTPEQARTYFAKHGDDRIESIAAGGIATPGSCCVQCKAITACAQLPKAPGLLGLRAVSSPLRQTSISNLRYYAQCPAQEHMRSLNLPRSDEYSDAAVRGQAVHAHLEINHRNPFHVPCTAADLAVNSEDWSASRWRVRGDQAPTGAAMLRSHLEVCPFDNPVGVSDVRVEPVLAFHDTAVSTVVIAKPDLLYTEAGSWIWRETKSTQKHRWPLDDPLEQFPQLALAVLILARGLLGGDPAGSRVELETLRTYAGEVDLIDPNDPERVAKAQRVMRSLAEPWHTDREFAANPGPACYTCPFTRWCPDFPGFRVGHGGEGDDA